MDASLLFLHNVEFNPIPSEMWDVNTFYNMFITWFWWNQNDVT